MSAILTKPKIGGGSDLFECPAEGSRAAAIERSQAGEYEGSGVANKSLGGAFIEKRSARTGKQAMQALGRLKTGQMNRTEAAYAMHLQMRVMAGEVAWFKFEGMKLRLADNTFYSPDFAVMLATGELEQHEVKGFWQDDARAKIKIAADMYPFRFVAVKAKAKKDGGGWAVEEF